VIKKLFIVLLLFFLVSCNPKKIDKTDYVSLGFPQNFNLDYEINDYWFTRQDGLKNILSEITPEELRFNYNNPFANEEELIQKAFFKSYFNDESYNIFYSEGLSKEYLYSVGVQFEKTDYVYGEYKFVFYPIEHWTTLPLSYLMVDVIESNGYYSFVLNYRYDDSNFESVKTHFFTLFYVIYHENNFPYTVYYDNTYIYLMNKSSNFDASYKTLFKENNVFLFKD